MLVRLAYLHLNVKNSKGQEHTNVDFGYLVNGAMYRVYVTITINIASIICYRMMMFSVLDLISIVLLIFSYQMPQ